MNLSLLKTCEVLFEPVSYIIDTGFVLTICYESASPWLPYSWQLRYLSDWKFSSDCKIYIFKRIEHLSVIESIGSNIIYNEIRIYFHILGIGDMEKLALFSLKKLSFTCIHVDMKGK